jgi:hypothetical protein
VILRFTRKLLAVIGPLLAADEAPAPDGEDWYANLLWFDRREGLPSGVREAACRFPGR